MGDRANLYSLGISAVFRQIDHMLNIGDISHISRPTMLKKKFEYFDTTKIQNWTNFFGR